MAVSNWHLKTLCLSIGNHKLTRSPSWFLYGNEIQHSDSLDVRDVTFNNQGKSDCLCNSGIQRCRRGFYSLANVGVLLALQQKLNPTCGNRSAPLVYFMGQNVF